MRINTRHVPPAGYTHEGAPAKHIPTIKELRRAVMSCLLWEDQFYESGESIADRITKLCAICAPSEIAALAIEARKVMNLRHVPLLLLVNLLRKDGKVAAETIPRVISRTDEMAELLAIYDKLNKRGDHGQLVISRSLRKGLQSAIVRFDEYGLAKYDRRGAFTLRDVFRITRAKPTSEEQSALWKRAVKGELATPDTWEVALSGGADKQATWIRLIVEGKLGYLALLRNLRNMIDVGVPFDVIERALLERKNGANKVFPFRFIAAVKAAPALAMTIDQALCATIKELPEPGGTTFILVDVSGSMDDKLSGKSELTRLEAGAALASLWPGNRRVFTFSNQIVEVPAYPGGAGMAAIIQSQQHGATYLGQAVQAMNTLIHNNGLNNGADRLIVITDEQSHDPVPTPKAKHNYLINVASYKNGVGYGPWTHIDGFSEGVLRYIYEMERAA